jgi:hypothetical protein
MTIKLSNLTFTDEDDIIPASAVEQILNTEVANTLADDDIIIGTGNDYDFENVSVLSTDDGNDDTITGIENLEPEFDSSYDLVSSGTLNADEDKDILTGTSRDDGIVNSGRLNADEDNDTITGTASRTFLPTIGSLTIHSIKCLRANADYFGPDDTYITVNGRKIWGDYNMKRGRTRSVNSHYQSPFATEAVRVELLDYDWSGAHDKLGGFFAVRTNGVVKKQVQGSGSIYEVYYSAW